MDILSAKKEIEMLIYRCQEEIADHKRIIKRDEERKRGYEEEDKILKEKIESFEKLLEIS